jgi:hypothetical protein
MMTRLWDDLQDMEPGRVVCSAVVIWQMDDGNVAMATAIHPAVRVVNEDGSPSQKGINATVANIIEHSAQELRKRTHE